MMKKAFKYLLTTVILSVLGLSVCAYTPGNLPNPKTSTSDSFVCNPDGVLAPSTVATIDATCYRLRSEYNVELAVVAVKSIDGAEAADFAQELFMLWGIGGRDKNQGVLMLLSTGSRDLRIHTGGGMEGVLPDAVCTRIFRTVMRPYLAGGAWDEGVLKGVEAIEGYITNPAAATELLSEGQTDSHEDLTGLLYGYLVFVLLLSMVMLFLMYRDDNWNPSASNNVRYAHAATTHDLLWALSVIAPVPLLGLAFWFRRIRKGMRTRPVTCPCCGRQMVLQSEAEEDAYLSEAHQTEERVGSVDYDVWHCFGCDNNIILGYKNIASKYKKCPSCGAATYALSSDVVIRTATTLHSGAGEKTYSCRHCGHRKVYRYTIPRIVVVHTGGGGRGGSGFGGGGGFSGGSWGGGISFGGGGGGKF